ncbi:thioredoxin-like protein YneN [Patiriisocius marinus]|uniref:Thioredoxin-like protein YneN n=2 Tax=Patiriisocius marinus TaxID=1397112 RepID=A0A5J4J4W2_9FLAO|nr:thioredoxin-like protein YneN [Patiriisocius marinus]
MSFSPSEISKNDQLLLHDYNWSLSNLKGASTNLKNNEGNILLINKWATWCPPCVAEMPSLQKLYNAYGDKVSFYFITDEAPEKLNAFMLKNGYDFPVYISRSSAPKKLNSNSLPTTYLIGKDGAIVIQKVGAADWNSNSVHETLDRLMEL